MDKTRAASTVAWVDAFESRVDLNIFGDNAIGLFALALQFDVDDLVTIGASAITDGNDDKKCDLVYVNRDDYYAVIGQCYFSSKIKASAPSNKAADLNTAIGWLLQQQLDQLPPRLQAPAEELRNAIEDNSVESLYVWYVHNLPESKNVADELKNVETTLRNALDRAYPGKSIKISAREVGSNTLMEWYHDTQTPILVTDEIKVEITSGYEFNGPNWHAYVTTIPARFLYNQFHKHRTRLFSANIRDYLGSRQSDSNINNGIKRTLKDASDNFWVFNNGVTILVHDFTEIEERNRKFLSIRGMSIVNGAQTTGAIGTGANAPDVKARVLARFVKTSDRELIHNIVQYNNSQNKITASDFRSTDKIQRRLKEEFNKIPSAEYEGGRRGGSDDAIKRRQNLLPSYTVGQALAAFHGDPVVAYNQKSDIWINDRLYSRYFNDEITAYHIIFCYTLLKAVDQKKVDLMMKSKGDGVLTEAEQDQLAFLRVRGSNYLLVSAIAGCLETIIGRPISNLFRLHFSDKISPVEAQKQWSGIVEMLLPLSTQLNEAFSNGLKSLDKVKAANKVFSSLVLVSKKSIQAECKSFTKVIAIKQ